MSMHTLSALLAALLTFVIGWSVLLRDRRQRPYVSFSVLCFNLAFWYLSTFFTFTLKIDLLQWVTLFFAAGIPSSAERFFRSFLSDDPRRPRRISRPVLAGTAVVYALLVLCLFYPLHRSLWFIVPVYSFIVTSLCYCIYLIYDRKRSLRGRAEATRLTYLLWGGVFTVTLAVTDFMPRIGITFPAVGSLLTVIYLYFISQTLFHYRLLDIKELLGKMVTLSTLVLILSVVYGLLLAWVGPEQSGVFFFNTIVASFVIMVIFEPLRHLVEDRVNRWLFAEKYEFSRRLRLLNRDLANIIEVRVIVSRLLMDLEDSGRVTHAAIYLADPSGAKYRLAGHVGPTPIVELDGTTRRLFLERLRTRGMVSIEGIDRALSDPSAGEEETVPLRNVKETMEELLADICIPLLSERQLLGFLNLRDDRLREAYASDELEQLRQLAAQAAITLRNSKVYEQMKERDRLAALGQMAAGLAHEIRNPLGSIKGAAQLLKVDAEAREEEGAAEEPETAAGEEGEDREFLGIIVEEVDRLDHVVSQFLGYARPDSGERESLNVNDVVRKTVQLLRSQQESEVEIETKLAQELPEVRADPEQLRQVFLNLGINAIQAMDGGGRLVVETRLRRSFKGGRSSRLLEIAFRDRGLGIAPETLPDIFIPFFTTKQGGTGLGLPICQRIIENHGGLIEVQSEPKKGSAFNVLLPVADDGDVTGTHALGEA